ncbi:acyltransferase [Candidatus Woesearchaeota archaeon]|nr:acyltransferase [Candidatus Woesearchaeota archaeon]
MGAILFNFKNLKINHTINQRILFFDFIKGVAIVFIIMIHLIWFLDSNYVVLHEFFWFAIPLFILVSGILLGKKYESKITIKKFYYSMFERVFLPYALFVMLLIIFYKPNLSFQGFLEYLFLGTANGNFYFIPLIIQLYLLFPLILKYKKFIVSYLGLAVSFVFSFFMFILEYYLQTPNWNSNPYSLAFCGRFFFFFVFGIYFSKFDLKSISFRKFMIPLAIYLLSVLFFSSYVNHFYSMFIYSIFIFFAMLLLKNKFFVIEKSVFYRYFCKIGKHTLIMYLVHTILLFNLFMPIYTNFNLNLAGWLFLILMTFLLLLSSYYFSIIYMYIFKKILNFVKNIFCV